MSYLASSDVKVYPSALRGGTDGPTRDNIYDPESRIGTEFNLTNAVNRLTIDGSFVIDAAPQSGWLQFSIHGYYFKAKMLEYNGSLWVPNAALGLASATSIYASIRLSQLSETSTSVTYQLLSLDSWNGTTKILDDSSSFVGLQFSDNLNDSTYQRENCYSLLLLRKSGDEWIVPATSYLRFDSAAVAIGNTPLSDVLSEADGEVTLDVDHANIGDATFNTATINTLNNTTLVGSNGTISKGVANKAVAISDPNGVLRSTNATHPIYLNANGVPTEITGSISNDTTGNAATATLAAAATKLNMARTVRTDLASTTAASFDGTANITPGITGTLQPDHGGTGATKLADVTVGTANKLGTQTIGGYTAPTSGGPATVSTVRLSSGSPYQGLVIYASSGSPTSGIGKNGDIWFQYN